MKLKIDNKQNDTIDDVMFIDDDRGIALLHDIEEIVNTRAPGKSILTSRGSFIYELRYYLDSFLASKHELSYVSVDVYTTKVKNSVNNQRSDNPAAHRNNILNRKNKNSKQKVPPFNDSAQSFNGHIAHAKFVIDDVVTQSLNNHKVDINIIHDDNLNNVKNVAKTQSYTFHTNDKNVDDSKFVVIDKNRMNLDVSSRYDNSPYMRNNSPFKNRHINEDNEQIVDNNDISNVKQLNYDLVFKYKLDTPDASKFEHPAATVLDQRNGVHTNKKSRGNLKLTRDSVLQKNNKVDRNHKNIGHVSSVNDESDASQHNNIDNSDRRLLNHVLAQAINKHTSIDKRSARQQNDDNNAIVSIESRCIESTKLMDIDISAAGIADKLYFEISLYDINDEQKFSKSYVIDHRNQLSDYLEPETAPTIGLGAQLRGLNYITISQNDPTACNVIIQKRTLNPNMDNINVPFVEIANIELTNSMGAYTFEDTEADNIEPNIIIYRAIPVGPLNQQGSDFGSLVASGLKSTIISSSNSFDRVKCSLHAINNGNEIKILLSNIPEHVVGISLLREDMTSDSFTYSSGKACYKVPVNDNNDTMLMLSGPHKSITFVDTNVEPFRTYKYRCIFRMTRGPEQVSLDEEIIHHLRPSKKLPVKTVISDISVTKNNISIDNDLDNSNHQSDNSVGVKFNIDAVPAEEGIEDLMTLLTTMGVDQVFIDELKQDRSRITDMAAFVVERLNITSGRRESFGVVFPGIFEDNAEIRQKNNIQPHVLGTKYRYVVKLCLRPPEALFKKAMTSVIAQNPNSLDSLEKSLQRSSQRFMTSYGQFPSMPSEFEISNFSSSDVLLQILKGQTGDEKFIDIDITAANIKITDMTVTRSRLGYNIINWNIQGNKSLVDHFVINAKFKGIIAPIGICSVNQFGKMVFHDKKLSGEIGTIVYSICIVYTDMSKDDNVVFAQIENDNSMSRKLISKLMSKSNNNVIVVGHNDNNNPRLDFEDKFAAKRKEH